MTGFREEIERSKFAPAFRQWVCVGEFGVGAWPWPVADANLQESGVEQTGGWKEVSSFCGVQGGEQVEGA